MHAPTALPALSVRPALSVAGDPRPVVPLFVTTAERAHAKGRPWIALGALAPDTRLDDPLQKDVPVLGNSFTSCESEPMCSMAEAANASPTRAPILGRSKRREVCSEDADNLFPCLLRISKALSVVSV